MSLRHLFVPLALVLPAVCVAGTDMATLFPENTVAFAQVRDVPALRKLEDHAIVKMFDQPALKPIFGKIKEEIQNEIGEDMAKAEMEIQSETGLSSMQLLEKFNGAIAVAVHDLKLPPFDSSDNPSAEVTIAADFTGDDALVEKFIKAMDKAASEGGGLHDNFEERIVEHAGAKIHVLKEKDDEDAEEVAWAATGGKLLFATGENEIKEAIDRAKGDGGSNLTKNAVYRELLDVSPNADIIFAAPLKETLSSVEELLRKQIENGSNNLPVNPLAIWSGLGADKVRGGVMGARFVDNSKIEIEVGLTYDEKPGLFSLIVSDGPGKAPEFIPTDIHDASYGTFKWDSFYRNLKKLLGEVVPMAVGAMEMGVNQLKEKTGVDLEGDLLGNMGPGWWAATHTDFQEMANAAKDGTGNPGTLMGLAGQSVILGIQSKDAKALGLAVKSMINGLAPQEGLFEEREYQGFTINNIKEMPDAFPVGWLLTDDTLIVSMGKQDLLEKVLSRLSKPGGEHFFAQAKVQKALSGLSGPDVMGTGYSNLGSMATMLSQLLAAEMGLEDAEAKALREAKFPAGAASTISVGDKAAVIRERIAPNE